VQIYEDTIKSSYAKPNRTIDRSRASAANAVDERPAGSGRRTNRDRTRFTILDRDAQFKPEYMKREQYRSVNDTRRREHFQVDLDEDLDEQVC
jgi:hypothetical protein